jgi:hypothetical protein
MQSDEIAEAVRKERKIILDSLISLILKQLNSKQISYNLQFSATILNLWLVEVLIICNWIKIRNVLESVRICFQKDIPQPITKQILATLVSKYHVGADTILLSWVLKHP